MDGVGAGVGGALGLHRTAVSVGVRSVRVRRWGAGCSNIPRAELELGMKQRAAESITGIGNDAMTIPDLSELDPGCIHSGSLVKDLRQAVHNHVAPEHRKASMRPLQGSPH